MVVILRVPLCHLCSEGGVIYTLMQYFCAGSSSAQQCASHTHDGTHLQVSFMLTIITFLSLFQLLITNIVINQYIFVK